MPDDYTDFPTFSTAVNYLIPNIFSGVATTIVIIILLMTKFWQRPLMTMIFSICLADWIFSFSKLSALALPLNTDTLCKIFQIFSGFGLEASAVLGACFAHSLYSILKKRNTNLMPSMIRYYLIIAFSTIITSSIAPFFDFIQYSEEMHCCIHRVYKEKTNYVMFLCSHLPIFFAIVCSIVWYILSYSEYKKLSVSGNVKESLTLMMYPGILIICWIPIISVELLAELDITFSDILIKWLKTLAYSMGFFDALIYGEGTKGIIRRFFRKIRFSSCCCTPSISAKDSQLMYQSAGEELFTITDARIDFYQSFNSNNSNVGSKSDSPKNSLKNCGGTTVLFQGKNKTIIGIGEVSFVLDEEDLHNSIILETTH